MANTSQFELPLLAGGQAQKNVTVNEALSILDAVAQLRIVSANQFTPPPSVADGEAYAVPANAVGDWADQGGSIAVSCNGGWRFLTPKAGWRAYNVETGTNQLFDGTGWLDSTLAATPSGTATEFRIVEIDHDISAGPTSVTTPVIPNKAQVIGVTARVIQPIIGSLSTWRLSVEGVADRYGDGYGTALNSEALSLTSSPVTYYAPTALELIAEGGEFTSGRVRLAVHMLALSAPRMI